MRTRILTTIILGGAMAASAHLGAITTPKADTTITPGTTVVVRWTTSVQHETMDIAYSQNGTTWTNIQTGLAKAQASFNWAVPANFPASTTTRLRVCQRASSACTDGADHNVSNLSTPKGGAYTAVTANFKIASATKVDNALAPLPGAKMKLNPATRAIDLNFDLSQPVRVTLKAFDSQGKLLAVLLDEERAAGRHSLSVSSGALEVSKPMVFRLQAGDKVLQQDAEAAR